MLAWTSSSWLGDSSTTTASRRGLRLRHFVQYLSGDLLEQDTLVGGVLVNQVEPIVTFGYQVSVSHLAQNAQVGHGLRRYRGCIAR